MEEQLFAICRLFFFCFLRKIYFCIFSLLFPPVCTRIKIPSGEKWYEVVQSG